MLQVKKIALISEKKNNVAVNATVLGTIALPHLKEGSLT